MARSDPTRPIDLLHEVLPRSLIRSMARQLGCVHRQREVDAYDLFVAAVMRTPGPWRSGRGEAWRSVAKSWRSGWHLWPLAKWLAPRGCDLGRSRMSKAELQKAVTQAPSSFGSC